MRSFPLAATGRTTRRGDDKEVSRRAAVWDSGLLRRAVASVKRERVEMRRSACRRRADRAPVREDSRDRGSRHTPAADHAATVTSLGTHGALG